MPTPPKVTMRPNVLLLFAGMMSLAALVVLVGAYKDDGTLLQGGIQLCSTVIGAAGAMALKLATSD